MPSVIAANFLASQVTARKDTEAEPRRSSSKAGFFFRVILAKIPVRGGAAPPFTKMFSKYIEAEYFKMNAELKKVLKN